MRRGVHHHYLQLKVRETAFVDEAIASIGSVAECHQVPLGNDDRIERVVDALARAVLESRRATP